LAPSLLTVSPELSIGGQDLSNKLIVIIDDETMILDATRSILTQWGCDVLAANSGAEALEKLATSPRVPDAIICDHRLQNEETGVDVIAALRDEFNLEIPAVLITGDTSPEQIRIITSAALPVLHKPLQSDVLKEMLVKLIINGN
jgi:CheY-like chemotaxis protein